MHDIVLSRAVVCASGAQDHGLNSAYIGTSPSKESGGRWTEAIDFSSSALEDMGLGSDNTTPVTSRRCSCQGLLGTALDSLIY